MVVDTPLTTTTSMVVVRVAQRQVLTMVVEQLPTTTIDMEVVLAQLQHIQVMEVDTPLTTTTDTGVAQVVQRQVLTMVVGQLPTTTTSMAVVSVLLRHIPTMVVERLRPIMTFMVITSAPVAIGDIRSSATSSGIESGTVEYQKRSKLHGGLDFFMYLCPRNQLSYLNH